MSQEIQTTYRQVEGTLKSVQSKVPNLGPHDVLVKITHASLCGTDLGFMPFGLALGHEGIGIVEAKGNSVTQVEIGDRVGGGYFRDSCGNCQYCLKGQDIWCYQRMVFGEGDYDNGTFNDYYIGKESYIHKIPETIKSEYAAPLQCAGVTVYGAMIDVVKPFHRVGIIGIGGLGHLAIQFATKLGAQVVVFSHSKGKEAEARSFGASEFYTLDNVGRLKAPVDVLVLTGNTYPDWSKFLTQNVLARTGTLIPICEPHDKLELPAFQMFFNGYNVHSSLVGSRAIHNDALNFAALHDIKPTIETFDLSEEGVQAAINKLKAGKVRYRAVLTAKQA